MEEIISKKELDEFLKMPGQVRGNGLKTVADFILKKEGENGLLSLEKAMADFGCSIKLKEIKPLDFYPLGFLAIILISTSKLFNYGRKEIMEIGESDVRFSPILKLFVKYYISIAGALKAAPLIFKKYFTTGELKVVEYNEDQKIVVLRVENFKLTPVHCYYLAGYFLGVVKMIKSTSGICEETKCVHRGDDFHEFVVRW